MEHRWYWKYTPLFRGPPVIATQANVRGEPCFTLFHLWVNQMHMPSVLVILEGLRPDVSRKIYSHFKSESSDSAIEVVV